MQYSEKQPFYSEQTRGLLTKNRPIQTTLGFIGGGNMATSLISGLIADGIDSQSILVSDTEHEKLANLAARFSIRSAANNQEVAERAKVLILAVKPQTLRSICQAIQASVQQHRPLVISIAA